MKYKNLRYRIGYTMRCYYMEHRYIVYLPIVMIIGMIIGIIVVANNGNQIANFIDSALEDEYSYGGAFMREFSLYIIVLLSLLSTLFSRYCHIFSISSLLLVGYRFGYQIGGLVVGGIAGGIIQIIVVNIPFVIIAMVYLSIFYSYIASSRSFYCIRRSGRWRNMCINIAIYTLIYMFIIVYFHILVPRIYILIFL